MKTTRTILALTAVGLGALLTSCYDPYYGSTSSTVVTHHRPGYAVQTLPPRYSTVTISGTRYYHHDGVYYRPQGSRYIVVEDPRGHRRGDGYRSGRGHRSDVTVIRTLPRGHRVITHGGNRYYYHGNTYYQSRGDGYVIVENPIRGRRY